MTTNISSVIFDKDIDGQYFDTRSERTVSYSELTKTFENPRDAVLYKKVHKLCVFTKDLIEKRKTVQLQYTQCTEPGNERMYKIEYNDATLELIEHLMFINSVHFRFMRVNPYMQLFKRYFSGTRVLDDLQQGKLYWGTSVNWYKKMYSKVELLISWGTSCYFENELLEFYAEYGKKTESFKDAFKQVLQHYPEVFMLRIELCHEKETCIRDFAQYKKMRDAFIAKVKKECNVGVTSKQKGQNSLIRLIYKTDYSFDKGYHTYMVLLLNPNIVKDISSLSKYIGIEWTMHVGGKGALFYSGIYDNKSDHGLMTGVLRPRPYYTELGINAVMDFYLRLDIYVEKYEPHVPSQNLAIGKMYLN